VRHAPVLLNPAITGGSCLSFAMLSPLDADFLLITLKVIDK
jgi:hypothetical protein